MRQPGNFPKVGKCWQARPKAHRAGRPLATVRQLCPGKRSFHRSFRRAQPNHSQSARSATPHNSKHMLISSSLPRSSRWQGCCRGHDVESATVPGWPQGGSEASQRSAVDHSQDGMWHMLKAASSELAKYLTLCPGASRQTAVSIHRKAQAASDGYHSINPAPILGHTKKARPFVHHCTHFPPRLPGCITESVCTQPLYELKESAVVRSFHCVTPATANIATRDDMTPYPVCQHGGPSYRPRSPGYLPSRRIRISNADTTEATALYHQSLRLDAIKTSVITQHASSLQRPLASLQVS